MITSIDSSLFVQDSYSKYKYVYMPSHELANKAGKVYEHIYVMCKHINRPLKEDEVVHHKDRDRANNDIDNLLLLTNAEHIALHAKEDGKDTLTEFICKYCNQAFVSYPKINQKYCSDTCANLANRKFDITPDALHALVWKYPTTTVAKMFGVSDKAIEKRCKLYGIPKPPRGYWAKIKAKS